MGFSGTEASTPASLSQGGLPARVLSPALQLPPTSREALGAGRKRDNSRAQHGHGHPVNHEVHPLSPPLKSSPRSQEGRRRPWTQMLRHLHQADTGATCWPPAPSAA